MPKVKTKKGRDKVAEYYSSLDLRTWWESFSTECNENGTRKYKTVWSFISAKTKEQWKRDFLWWILGPIGKSEIYKNYEQFDWETKLEKGFWYSSENATKLQKEVKNHSNALESLKEVGKVNIEFISRLVALAKEIDREFSGRVFLPNLSMKENSLRANTYTALLDQLQTMLDKAQIMFGRTQGMDLERLDQFFTMFGTGMGQAAAQLGFTSGKQIEGQTKEAQVIDQINRMVLAKAAANELDLPDEDMNKIIVAANGKRARVN